MEQKFTKIFVTLQLACALAGWGGSLLRVVHLGLRSSTADPPADLSISVIGPRHSQQLNTMTWAFTLVLYSSLTLSGLSLIVYRCKKSRCGVNFTAGSCLTTCVLSLVLVIFSIGFSTPKIIVFLAIISFLLSSISVYLSIKDRHKLRQILDIQALQAAAEAQAEGGQVPVCTIM